MVEIEPNAFPEPGLVNATLLTSLWGRFICVANFPTKKTNLMTSAEWKLHLKYMNIKI